MIQVYFCEAPLRLLGIYRVSERGVNRLGAIMVNEILRRSGDFRDIVEPR